MIKLYADGAAMDGIITASYDPKISGFTTNPTLMRQAGVDNYEEFAKRAIKFLAEKRPETNLSLEVFADDKEEMIRQARLIDSWGEQHEYSVYVKIPVMHCDGSPTYDVISKLSEEGIKVNVTAIFSMRQIYDVINNVSKETSSIVSIFAGRIADVGEDPVQMFNAFRVYRESLEKKNCESLWASSREAYNYVTAKNCGADIITMTPDLIKKVNGFGKDLEQFSQETCQMFYDDAVKSGFSI